jgi:hypothetical protein
MLVKGWVADSRQRVRLVNRVLRDWLRRNHPAVETRLNSAYGVPIVEFLESIMEVAPEKRPLVSRILDVLGRHIYELPSRISGETYRSESEFQADDVSVSTEIYTLSIQRQNNKSGVGDYRGAEVRASIIGGFPLVDHRSEGIRVESVDIAIFGQLKWSGEWKLVGYQGLFERATEPNEEIKLENIRAGALALMGRNLSHNIGSHALYWLEQSCESLHTRLKAREIAARDAQEAEGGAARVVTEVDPYVPEYNNGDLSRFYKYVRERMELLAGLVTGVPLAPRTFPMQVMVDGFESNLVLLRYLCKSEGVGKVEVEYKEDAPCNVSLPGGSMGMQLFYSLLENVIRDNAKYGPHGAEMGVTIEVKEVPGPDREECLKVRVIGQQADNVDAAVDFISGKLSTIEITDSVGKLLEGVWGIKERYIAAALLRGLALQDLDPALKTRRIRGALSTNPVALENKPILTVLAEDHRLVWEFYLLKGKDVLLIRESFFTHKPPIPGVQYENFSWLGINLGDGSSIRHSFVVVCPKEPGSKAMLIENRRRLPYRTFLAESGKVRGEHPFTPLDENLLDLTSGLPTVLYKAWVESLDTGLAGRFLLITGEGYTRILEWGAERDERINLAELKVRAADPACLGIFSRHWPKREDDLFELGKGKHREVFGNSSLHSIFKKEVIEGVDKYALFESVLIRVLVIDERLDRSVDDLVNVAHGVTVRGRLEMKGIQIYGSVYGESDVPDLETLIAETIEDSPYHFVCVHRGVLDKLEKTHGVTSEKVCDALRQYSKNVLIHSGRVGRTNVPEGVRTIPLSNVIEWKGAAVSKMDVVNEICSFRGPS